MGALANFRSPIASSALRRYSTGRFRQILDESWLNDRRQSHNESGDTLSVVRSRRLDVCMARLRCAGLKMAPFLIGTLHPRALRRHKESTASRTYGDPHAPNIYRSYLAMWTLGLLLRTSFGLRSLILCALARFTLWPKTSSIVNRFRQMWHMIAPTRGRLVQAQSTLISPASGIIQTSLIKPAPLTLDCTDQFRIFCLLSMAFR